MIWTDERVQTLRALWAEGLPGAQIARDMSVHGRITFSRSAILGKICRLGLQRRIPRTKTRYDQPKPKRVRAVPVRVAVVQIEPRRIGAPPRPTPKNAPKRKFSEDPASQIAAALLASADSAQRRRDQMQHRAQW